MNFGERLKEIRLQKDYSLYDVGEKVDVSHSYIKILKEDEGRCIGVVSRLIDRDLNKIKI